MSTAQFQISFNIRYGSKDKQRLSDLCSAMKQIQLPLVSSFLNFPWCAATIYVGKISRTQENNKFYA